MPVILSRERFSIYTWYALCLFLFLAQCPAHAAVSITDDSGNTVTLPAPAARIIPLYSGLAETLAAMGAADRIIARTDADTTLPGTLPSIGTHMRPNQELIAGLRPDLVVQFEGREEAGLAAASLARLGINVARFRVSSFADLFSCIERLGVLSGEEEAAAALAANIRARLDRVREAAAKFRERPKVFFEVRYPNLLGAGAGSMVNDIIRMAGGDNCLGETPERMVRLSEEALLLKNPDIYLVQQGPMNKSPIPVKERAHYRSIAAVQNNFVKVVSEAVFSRPGPQSVVAAEELAFLIQMWHISRRPDDRAPRR